MTQPATQTAFERELVARGTDPAVAAELERRIEIIEREEADDPSRLPLSAGEIVGYVAVTLVAVAIGVVVMVL